MILAKIIKGVDFFMYSPMNQDPYMPDPYMPAVPPLYPMDNCMPEPYMPEMPMYPPNNMPIMCPMMDPMFRQCMEICMRQCGRYNSPMEINDIKNIFPAETENFLPTSAEEIEE